MLISMLRRRIAVIRSVSGVGSWQRKLLGASIADRGVVLVTDDRVGPLYGASLKAALGDVSQLTEVVLPAGEAHKDLASIHTILDAALADKHERGSLFVAWVVVWWVT